MLLFYRFKSPFMLLILGFSALFLHNCCNNGDAAQMENNAKEFIKSYTATYEPLSTALNKAYFDASINSSPELWDKVTALQINFNNFLSNKENFKKIKDFKESALIKDSLVARQLTVMFNECTANQVDTAKLNKLSKMTSDLEMKYSNFRATVGSKTFSDNDVEETLKKSTDNKELQDVWTAHKLIGPLVADDIKNIIRLRNEIAKELGYTNFHTMSLKLSEQEPAQIEKLFDELDNLTRDAFASEKAKMDKILAARLSIKPEELMPWDYQNRYFQEAPKVYNLDLDVYFQKIDIVKTTEEFYKGLGMPIEDLVAGSDLFERPKKNQHAYCINIDRKKDIRVLCNLKSTAGWMETMLHEFGHALYEKHYNENLPYILRTPAHIFTTEAVAMMFERFPTNPKWLHDVIGISNEDATKIAEDTKNITKLKKLVFSRWAQVMYRFEKAMYADPEQDLNKLWWDIVEKYQMIKRPAGRNMPDWATKIHIATSPCYYHNYLLGDLLASQYFITIEQKVLKSNTEALSFKDKKEVGKFFIDNIFAPGNTLIWNKMIEKATGEPLSAKFYAKQFVN
ncbi:MAG: M2 family metallopeptidase [Candidatus Kapabacteria bacterium]|nr:M2 family metallopeptidase [Candidatus Kapabacteria bacterium]